MKRVSLAFLVILVSVAALASVSTTVLAAPATKEPFYATTIMTGMELPERSWIDGGGGGHMRGMTVTDEMTGDIVGVMIVSESANVDPFGRGTGQAKGVIYVDGEEAYSVSIVITAVITTGGVDLSGTFVFQGKGNYQGIHVTGTMRSSAPSIAEWIGTKLVAKP